MDLASITRREAIAHITEFMVSEEWISPDGGILSRADVWKQFAKAADDCEPNKSGHIAYKLRNETSNLSTYDRLMALMTDKALSLLASRLSPHESGTAPHDDGIADIVVMVGQMSPSDAHLFLNDLNDGERSQVLNQIDQGHRQAIAACDEPEPEPEPLGTHICPAPGCKKEISTKYFMCSEHWAKVDNADKIKINQFYRPGQEIDRNPSPLYVKAARSAIASLSRNTAKSQGADPLGHVEFLKRCMNGDGQLQALTLKQPWAYAVTSLGKDVENRTWDFPLKAGEWFAIHEGANSGYDKNGELWIDENVGPDALDGHRKGYGPGKRIVAIARYGGIQQTPSKWAIDGQRHHGIVQVQVLPSPVENVRGQQKFFGVTKGHTRLILKQFAPSCREVAVNPVAVKNVKGMTGFFSNTDFYIGRGNTKVERSPLNNPYRLAKESERPEVIAKFIEHELIPALEAQEGNIYSAISSLKMLYFNEGCLSLYCHCAPKACHGDVLVKVIEKLAAGVGVAEVTGWLRSQLPAKHETLI